MIIEVNLFYTNTKSVLWKFFFFAKTMLEMSFVEECEISILRERGQLESQERRDSKGNLSGVFMMLDSLCHLLLPEVSYFVNKNKT